MFKLLKIMSLSLLILTSACSKEEDKNVNVDGTEKLVIYSGDNQLDFSVEIADNKEALYQGLRGRTSLASDSGLLFDISLVPSDMDVAMWMKDTLIPLDMLFIDENGEIFFIHENAEPNSTDAIYPPKRPRAVLEVNAGTVADLDIKVGDRIKNRLLGNME